MQYASRFEATIVATADTIAAGTKDPVIQRRTLRWKLGVTPVVNQAAFMTEPEAAYVAMLTVATSMHEFLTHRRRHARPSASSRSSRSTRARSCSRAAIELGDRFLDEKELARVTADVEALVRAQPIRGEFVAEQVQSLVTASESSPIFDWVTAIPLSPFRALQGVDQGAQAIREFNDTAMEMSPDRRLDAAPDPLEPGAARARRHPAGRHRGELESFNALARSAESLSQTAQSLPESLRELLDEAERTGQSLGPLSQSLERSATAVAAAGTAWGGLVAQLEQAAGGSDEAVAPLRHPRVAADGGADHLGGHRAARAARFRQHARGLGDARGAARPAHGARRARRGRLALARESRGVARPPADPGLLRAALRLPPHRGLDRAPRRAR